LKPTITIRSFISILFFFCTTSLFGQKKLDKGVYFGSKLPFLHCYINVKDSFATLDVFYYKGGQNFGHENTRYLSTPKIAKKNLVLTDKEDSTEVYKNKSSLKIKFKGPRIKGLLIRSHRNVRISITNFGDSVIEKQMENYLRFCQYQGENYLKHHPTH
jgi:hypothetical protein